MGPTGLESEGWLGRVLSGIPRGEYISVSFSASRGCSGLLAQGPIPTCSEPVTLGHTCLLLVIFLVLCLLPPSSICKNS